MGQFLNFRNKIVPGCLIFMLVLVLFTGCTHNKIKVLLITGGHDFDRKEFFELFSSFPSYEITHLEQPEANRFIENNKTDEYPVLVFYDSWQEINEAQKEAYLELTRKGKGLLFLHHSLVSYQAWDEFTKLRGGRYHKSDPYDSAVDSRYKHDIELEVSIVDPSHPITKGMKDFTIHDEGYSNIRLTDDITPLLKTNDPDCAEVIGWTKTYNNSRIVYLMGGHDRFAYINENYRTLIENSLDYLSGIQK